MSSNDGTRSVRQSKRYSFTALYLSMSAKEKELEIEDDLAKGMPAPHADCGHYNHLLGGVQKTMLTSLQHRKLSEN